MALFLCAASVVGCGVVRTAASGPLPSVSPAPTAQAPAWFARYGPRGTVDTLAQIRVEFKQPLIPLEALESADEKAKLAYFSIEPALPGRFRFLTPHLVGFQADAALPVATRVRVTIKSGLTDLHGDRLPSDFAWTFETEPLHVTTQISSSDPMSLTPTLEFTSNAELDPTSLAQDVSVVTKNDQTSIPINIVLEKSEVPTSEDASQKFDPSIRTWLYSAAPQKPLAKSTIFELVISAGLLPAHGNLPLSARDAWKAAFFTFSPLEFRGLTHSTSNGDFMRFSNGDPVLAFNNPITTDSAQDDIAISPTPKPWASLVDPYNDQRVALDAAAFDPNTDYVITIGAGLTDTFGQTLGKQVTVRYKSGDVAPAFWSPTGLNIFPSGDDLQLQFSAINLRQPQYTAAYRVLQPPDLVYFDVTDLGTLTDSWLPDPTRWKAFPVHITRNQPAHISVPLRDLIGSSTGMLAYGATADAGIKGNGGSYFGAVQLTNLGVFAQWFPSSGLVRVHHLSNGSPSAGARVDIYPSKTEAHSGPTTAPCATGTTDAGGSALFTAASLRGCMSGERVFLSAPRLLAVAHEGADWSFARTDEWSGSYGYGIYSGWDDGTPQSRGTIYSDRDLYQQGEVAWFTGAAYYLLDGVLHRDAGARYRLTMEDADGNKTDLGVVTTDGFGSFSRKVTIAKNQALGYYAIRAKSGGGVVIDGQFRVAQFRPPNFKVTLTLDKQFAVAGSSVSAKSQSDYLFGSPVQGGKSKYYVTRRQTDFTPKGWDEYSFGKQWEWPDQPPSVDTDVLENIVALGSDGVATQRVDVSADLPYPMSYEVDAETTDVSNLSVADSKTFSALPADRLIGLKTDWIGKAKQPLSIGMIVTDPSGAAMRGQRVHVELDRIDYNSVMQIVEGGQSSVDQNEYKAVADVDVTSGPDPMTLTLTPPMAGSYRIRANLAGAKSDATASDSFVWATGDEPVFWASENPDQLQIKLDKASYRPGEMATALIQSPYPDAELYFAVIRHDAMYHVVRKVHGGAPTIQFRVTPDMLPNAAVEAVLVRTGSPLARTKPGSVESLARIGFAPFDVNLDAKHLKVSIAPRLASMLPGGRQTVDLTLRDAGGKPMRGEFVVAVANESVLQLSGYRMPDLVSIVYGDQDVDTRFADNRPNVVLRQPPSPIDKGWGFGGGLSSAAAGTRVRTNFQPLAYFNGAVQTDAQGRASIAFSVPDDLTTWRVMTVATGTTSGSASDYRFGTADATFVTTKPLMTNALLPQFARPGDIFEAGVSVTNPSSKGGTVNIRGDVSGALSFDEASGRATTDGTQATLSSATQAYRFPVVAGAAGDAHVRFDTSGGGMSDAFAVSIPVVPLEFMEQVVESGVTDARATIPVAVDPSVRTDAGGLDISLASTLLPEIVEPARDDLDRDCLPFLEPAATQLAIAAQLIQLQKKYGNVSAAFSPSQVAAKDLQYLATLRLPNGGFAYWPGGRNADAVSSGYAAESIAEARSAGIAVDPAMISGVRDFLHGNLANPRLICKDDQICVGIERFNALEALAALGETRNDFLSDIYALRDDFDLSTRIRLARYLLRLPAWQAQGRQMAAKFRESVYETGRAATVNAQHQWRWYDSVAIRQALMLRLMIDDGQNAEFIDRMVQGLLALRRHGTWAYAYEDAQALGGLIDYGAMQPAPPDFSATATLGTRKLDAVHFSGYANPIHDVRVPMAAMTPGSKPSLSLEKSGTGALHYFVAYSYALSGPQPGIIAGLRIIRYVRPANGTTILWESGLAAPSAPLSLTVGQVFDVELEVISDHPVDQVVITDPLPAGFEAVDASFQTSTQFFQATTDSWQLDYQAIYRDRVVAFGDHLDAGDYSFHYLVRSVTPGTFSWPGADAHLEYAPEIFGRTSSGTLQLK